MDFALKFNPRASCPSFRGDFPVFNWKTKVEMIEANSITLSNSTECPGFSSSESGFAFVFELITNAVFFPTSHVLRLKSWPVGCPAPAKKSTSIHAITVVRGETQLAGSINHERSFPLFSVKKGFAFGQLKVSFHFVSMPKSILWRNEI